MATIDDTFGASRPMSLKQPALSLTDPSTLYTIEAAEPNTTDSSSTTSSMKTSPRNANYFRFAGFAWLFPILSGMTMLGLFAYYIKPIHLNPADPLTLENVLQTMNYYIILGFGSQYVLQIMFIVALALHGAEAIIACALSIEMGCKNTYMMWTIQTMLLGYPSLRLLLLKRKFDSRI
jgi:Domain of unknown function (DUF4499)